MGTPYLEFSVCFIICGVVSLHNNELAVGYAFWASPGWSIDVGARSVHPDLIPDDASGANTAGTVEIVTPFGVGGYVEGGTTIYGDSWHGEGLSFGSPGVHVGASTTWTVLDW